MNKLQQTLVTLKRAMAAEKCVSGTTEYPSYGDYHHAVDHAIEVMEAVETFLTERQKNNCSSACSPLVAIAEGA
jgi:hypothetical protein